MSTLEKLFIERNNLSKANSYERNTKQSKKKKLKKGNKTRNQIIDPNSSDYNNQLLKANLRDKFKGYDYGLSDW